MMEPEDLAPLTVELDAEDIQRLWDGETVEVLAEERDERAVDVLEINYRSKGVIGNRTARGEWPELFESEGAD
jgi:hypothetical protein